MNNFFLDIYDFFARRRWAAIAIAVAVMLACAVAAWQMQYSEDIYDFLPRDKNGEKYASVYDVVGGQERIIIIFSNDGNGDSGSVGKIISAIHDFGNIWSGIDSTSIAPLQVSVDEGAMYETMEFVQRNYPYFLEQEDYTRADSLLSIPGYISRKLEENKKTLMLPVGGIAVQGMRYDPLGLFYPVLQRLRTFNPLGDKYRLIDGYVFDESGSKGYAFMTSPYGTSETMQNQRLADMINWAVESVSERHPDIKISSIGSPLIAVTNADQIKSDSVFTVSAAVILTLLVLVLAFRRGSDLFWIGFSVLFGWIFAIGVISILKDSISIIVLGIGSVIIGIAVNYPLHFIDHMKRNHDNRCVLRDMISPLLVGNITTVSAFMCLLLLKSESMRDLGLFGSLTLVGTILFVLVFLPLLVKPYKQESGMWHLDLGKYVDVPKRNWNKFALPIFLILTCLFAYVGRNASFDSDIRNINYMTQQQKEDFKELYAGLQQQDRRLVYVVTEGSDMQQALRNNEYLLNSVGIDTMRNVKISGIGGFVPSEHCQLRRLQSWQLFWDRHSEALAELERAGRDLGFSNKAFSPFIDNASKHHETQGFGYFEPITKLLRENYILQSGDSTIRIVNYVSIPDSGVIDFKEKLNAELSLTGGYAFDSSDIGNRLVSILSDEFDYIGFVCGFVVFFFLWLSYGRFELSILSFLPLAVGWIWIMGIMSLADIRFNIVNIILATFIFGQGDDYTIFITDGLIREYAYGRRVLSAYKGSVALSAAIMFIGMGILMFAEHPAMKSLGEVAVIGMATVVLMAYYLPTVVFKWLTTRHGVLREVPITFKRLSYSIFSFTVFLLAMYLVMIPFTLAYFHIGRITEKKRVRYHKILQKLSHYVIHHIPGVAFNYKNDRGEIFAEPSIIISNHQSHLDLMCIMMLAPKLVILTNDWVWKNPFYGVIIHHAEFYPVSDGMETNIERLKSLVARGYSVVVFPEGTRSADCSILRFHRGAFYLAQQLGVGILPVFLHGVGHVLPKNDFMLREGAVCVEVGERMTASRVQSMHYKELTSYYHKMYVERYGDICKRCETAMYYIPYVRSKYVYKGRYVEMSCNKTLRLIRNVGERAFAIDLPGRGAVKIINCGQGEYAWLYALANKDVEVYATDNDEEKVALARNMSSIPDNLHFITETELCIEPAYDRCIDVNHMLKI